MGLFFKNVSELNHSFIDDRGFLVGGTVSVNFIIDGISDVDTNTIRSQLKEILDDEKTGFGNKLWIIEGFSRCETKRARRGYVSITSSLFDAELESSKVLDLGGGPYGPEIIAMAIKNSVLSQFKKLYPNADLKCSTSVNPSLASPLNASFTTIDGNVNNGSFGFIELYKMVNTEEEAKAIQDLTNDIAKFIDRSIFVKTSQIIEKKPKATKVSQDNGWILFKDGHTIIEVDNDVHEHLFNLFEPRIKGLSVDLVFLSKGFNTGSSRKF